MSKILYDIWLGLFILWALGMLYWALVTFWVKDLRAALKISMWNILVAALGFAVAFARLFTH